MQKKLIALAVAGLASTGAFAQANVTVYGVADAPSTSFVFPTRQQRTGQHHPCFHQLFLIGFKGAEALGNGLTAVFQFESGVGFDNNGGLGASRDSFVGLPAASVPWFWVT
jgi:predicted porin